MRYMCSAILTIKRLNGWDDDQISGFEIFIDDFDELDRMTLAVRDAVGYSITEEEESYKIAT